MICYYPHFKVQNGDMDIEIYIALIFTSTSPFWGMRNHIKSFKFKYGNHKLNENNNISICIKSSCSCHIRNDPLPTSMFSRMPEMSNLCCRLQHMHELLLCICWNAERNPTSDVCDSPFGTPEICVYTLFYRHVLYFERSNAVIILSFNYNLQNDCRFVQVGI